MRAFSRDALEHYIPVIQEEVRSAVREWLEKDSYVLVYPEMKRLMFRIAMRILLGFDPDQIKTDEQELVEAFEEMIKNLFSLPVDVPFSGLYRVSSGALNSNSMTFLNNVFRILSGPKLMFKKNTHLLSTGIESPKFNPLQNRGEYPEKNRQW